MYCPLGFMCSHRGFTPFPLVTVLRCIERTLILGAAILPIRILASQGVSCFLAIYEKQEQKFVAVSFLNLDRRFRVLANPGRLSDRNLGCPLPTGCGSASSRKGPG